MTMLQTTVSSTEPTPAPEKASPASATPPALSPGEQRLRAVIEAVPVSVIALKPEGDILAANQAALEILGVKKLEELLGQNLKTRVAEANREEFNEFIARVSEGQAGSLEYELVRPDGSLCRVQTRAVVLRRDGSDSVACLTATWEITGRVPAEATGNIAGQEALRAQCQALEEALAETKGTLERLADERRVADDALREAQAQMQTAMGEADARREALARDWTADREALEARVRELDSRATDREAREAAARASSEIALRDVQEREALARQNLEVQVNQLQERDAHLVAQLASEQEGHRNQISRLERDHASALAARTTDVEQLEQTISDMRASYDAMLVGARSERDDLSATIHELECRYANLVKERDCEREDLENQVRAERLRAELLVDAHDELRRKLASVAHALKEATSGAEYLLTDCERMRALPEMNVPDATARPAPAPEPVTVTDDVQASVDSPWAF